VTTAQPESAGITATPQDHGGRLLIDGSLAFLVGVLAVLQARVNGQLAIAVDSGLEAAALSFGVGLVCLLLIVPLVPSARAGMARLISGVRDLVIPKWFLVGGLGGATFVAAQGITVPSAGVALFTVAVVGGLTAASLVVDRLGLGPGGTRPLNVLRVAAAVLAIVGVALAVSAQLGGESVGVGILAPMILAFIAGAVVAAQQAVNGRLAVSTKSPLVAALVNFTVGFTVLLLGAGLVEAFDGQAWVAPPAPWDQPGLWLGGPLGVAFVAIAAFTVRGLGVLLFSLISIVGQLIGGVAIDVINPIAGAVGLTWQTIASVALLIIATALASVGMRWGRMRS